jgi:hypothetical protein
MDAVTHAPRRDREHATQLAAAEHAQRGTWRNDFHGS